MVVTSWASIMGMNLEEKRLMETHILPIFQILVMSVKTSVD
jgi:hypothetical protein